MAKKLTRRSAVAEGQLSLFDTFMEPAVENVGIPGTDDIIIMDECAKIQE